MKFGAKTALGIDISQGRINLVLLRKGINGLKLLKTATAPVPDGMIEDGNVKDAATLAKTIKNLKSRHKMRAPQAAVSVPLKPLIVQIADIPKNVSVNIREYVQKEVKHCVAFSGKEIALDFCGINARASSQSRLCFAAADGQKVVELANALNHVGLNVTAIEPPLLAYVRALYAKKVASKFGCNMLLVLLQSDTLNLCVFKNQIIDFIRTKQINKETTQPDTLCQWLANQINEVIRFYNTDVPDSPQNWETTVIIDSVQMPQDAEESLKAKLPGTKLQLTNSENICRYTAVWQSGMAQTKAISTVAIGLAMKLLDENDGDLRINLLPPEASQIKAARKDVLTSTSIMAAILLIMIAVVSAMVLITKKVNADISHIKQTELSKDTRSLLQEAEAIDRQIQQVSDRKWYSILSSSQNLDWPEILNDIRKVTPKTLQITKLHSESNSGLYLEGRALSYETVYLFVDMLDKSEHISSASLTKTEKDNKYGGLVNYAINCSLETKQENN